MTSKNTTKTGRKVLSVNLKKQVESEEKVSVSQVLLQERKKCGSSFKKDKTTISTCSSTSKKPSKTKNIVSKDKKLKYEVLPIPTKSESDKKTYKVIKLGNGLICCLISDQNNQDDEWEDITSDEDDDTSSGEDDEEFVEEPDMSDTDAKPDTVNDHKKDPKMAAAALCVKVGSFYDPLNIPGMAHFLEHMVFMGSKKYPKENDFDSFIKKSGGDDNASTECEITTFHFEVLEKYLPKALDKFSQFFISPLCKKESMLKEREAIDAEFSQAKPKDEMRSEQLFFNMFRDDAKINTFMWGNLETLLYADISDEELHQHLHYFREKHYTANKMTLAVQARLPMEILLNYVLEYFSNIPVGTEQIEYPFTKYKNDIFDDAKFRRMYYVKPVKDTIELILTWKLPSKLHLYKTKPDHYLASLIGDESKGSLMSYLKNKVWAISLTAGSEDSDADHNSLYCLFQVTIVLTLEGLENIFEVISCVYNYLSMLRSKGPSQKYFQELKAISDMSFRFQGECSAGEYVEIVAENLQYFPSKDLLTGGSLFFEYSEKDILDVLDDLVPDNMNIMLFTSLLPPELEFKQHEKWFGTLYTDTEIPQKYLKLWSAQNPKSEFAMPKRNPFITDDFRILDIPEGVQEVPRLIATKENFCEICACMTDMLVKVINLMMSEETYPALVAQLGYSISVSDLGLLINVNGFSQKLQELVIIIARYLKDVPNIITEKIFQVIKYKQLVTYYNKFVKVGQLARDLRLKILVGKHYTQIQKHEAAISITFKKFKEFLASIFHNAHVQILVEGNVNEETAFQTAFSVYKELGYNYLIRSPHLLIKDNISEVGLRDLNEFCAKLTDSDCPVLFVDAESENVINAKKSSPLLQLQVYQLPLGEQCARAQSLNLNDGNSVVTNYYQIGPYTESLSVKLELLMMIIDEPLFDTLRTKQGLGYQVYCTFRDTFNILGYTITVVSQEHKHTVAKVEECIEVFRGQIGHILRKMSQKKFKSYVSDLMKIKMVADTHLKEEVDRHWQEIISQNYMFTRNQNEIKALEELTLSSLRRFWDNHNNANQKGNFHKLSIQIVGFPKRSSSNTSGNLNHTCSPKARRKRVYVSETTLESNKVDKYKCQTYKLDLFGSKEDAWSEQKHQSYFIKNVDVFVSSLNCFPSSVHFYSK